MIQAIDILHIYVKKTRRLFSHQGIVLYIT